jgi:hypothetical protein
MKTEEAAPANISVAQLGQVLTRKPAASPDPKVVPAKAVAPVTSREPLPPEDGNEAGADAPDLSQTATTEAGQTAEDGGQPTDDGGQTTETGEGEDQPEGEGQPNGDEASPPPASISDVVVNRLNSQLQPLIEELTKAGAKGALQILQKRIPKLVDQRDTERNARLQAEQKLTELAGELETARSQKPEDGSSRADPSHPEVAKVTSALHQVDGFIKLFKANPNGLEMDDGNGGKTQLSAEEVADHLDQLRDKRTELLTERKVTEQQVRQAHAQTVQQLRQKASAVYPWLTQADAPEQAVMKRILTAIPGLKEMADHEIVVARYLRGLAGEQAEAAKGKKPATVKAPPSREPTKLVTEAPSSKAGPANAKATAQKAVKEAEAQFKKTGKREDLQRWEAAKQQLKRAG